MIRRPIRVCRDDCDGPCRLMRDAGCFVETQPYGFLAANGPVNPRTRTADRQCGYRDLGDATGAAWIHYGKTVALPHAISAARDGVGRLFGLVHSLAMGAAGRVAATVPEAECLDPACSCHEVPRLGGVGTCCLVCVGPRVS